MVTTPFHGIITEVSDFSPAYGGKAFRYEITTPAQGKVYILNADAYLDMVPMRRSPVGRGFSEVSGDVGSQVSGDFLEWNGVQTVVKITSPEF